VLAGTAAGGLGRRGRLRAVPMLVLMIVGVVMAIVRHGIILQDSCMLALETL